VIPDRVIPDRVIPDRVILIGFMGSGKSTVGRILADRLGWDLADTDALIEARAGAPVKDIFRDLGERAFRDKEAEVMAALRGRTRLVVATGGGAPAQERIREFFSGAVAIFHLRVSLDAMRQRTGNGTQRPLLALGADALRSLYESRQPLYESLGVSVETDGRTPEEVAGEILLLLRSPTRDMRPGDNVSPAH
jgi:shikimate kinase